jgi:hypothetical protein
MGECKAMSESVRRGTQSEETEISILERTSFLENLGRQYHGARVRISTIGPLPGRVDHCRLMNIISEGDNVVFSMECEVDSETRFTVANPERLIARRNSDGDVQELEIVSLDGSVTQIWFLPAEENRDDVAA